MRTIGQEAPPELEIRPAVEGDCALILEFIRALARYEKMADQVTATEQSLRRSLFEENSARVLIGESGGTPVGFALYFHNYSTFLGKANLYLEDLFIREDFRGCGYGKAMLRHLAGIAVREHCGRLDWACLDWNEGAVAFYKGLGAVPMDEWTTFRLEGEALRRLGGE